MGLGSLKHVSLARAREKAAEAGRARADGIDPIEARQADRAAAVVAQAKRLSFKTSAEAFIAAKSKGWSNSKHADQWAATLAAYVYPVIGDLPVGEVDTDLVLRILEPIWIEKPETASRVRGRVEAILDAARVRGQREGENPARWRGHLDNLLAPRSKVRKVRHHPALPYEALPDFMDALAAQSGAAGLALEFTILTAARSGESLGATWPEIDFAAQVWTVPAERMKAGKEHRVPLSGPAIRLLERAQELAGGQPWLFGGAQAGRPLSNMAMLKVLERMGRKTVTVHGFRSTFRDWAAETTAYPNEVVEMALAHTIGNKAEAAYRRGDMLDRRRALMTDWAKYSGR